jgi:hypothetical protein
MIRRLYATVTLPIVAIGLGLGAAAFAHAQQSQGFTAQLAMLNDSGGSGTATATLNGTQLTVEIHSTGLTPNAPHAQHLHIGGTHTCPTIAADTDGDGLVNTTEGAPSYGPIKVSLTTSGDVTDASGLAVDRFPMADASGKLDYTRTFALPAGVTADDLKNAVVVQHGVDVDKSGKYDGTAKSDLDPSLPAEATLPADCGKGVAATSGGAVPTTAAGSATPSSGGAAAAATPTAKTGVTIPNTGDGTTAGGSNAMNLIIVGGIALAIAGAAVGAYGVKRSI